MHLDRSAGVLLHVTSLPGAFGVGDLGPGARRFVDFLEQAGQQVWQMLPLGPTVQGHSPYSCYSAFAGNPLLISLDDLLDAGWLSSDELTQLQQRSRATDPAVSDYAQASLVTHQALQWAFDRFLQQARCEQFDEFESFCTERKWWLDDFALFVACMTHFKTANWPRWDADLVHRDPVAVARWKERLAKQVEYHQFVQYLFQTQWSALRDYALRRGVKLFGDMPIFVAHGSADVWAHQRLFCLRADGQPKSVAGVPPDYFSKTGQLWGNPQYDWHTLQKTGYQWWIQRLRAALDAFDLMRIDHFRGFEAYWEVDAAAHTAATGRWVAGPGAAPFEAAQKILGELPIVAEDLGLITQPVHDLRDQLGFPGMRVLQFGFGSDEDDYHQPQQYPEHSVAYTGTHDNSTVVGWFQQRKWKHEEPDPLQQALAECNADDPLHWQLISMVYASASRLAMVPMQDLLGLDDRARLNFPGRAAGNWRWRCTEHQLSPDLAARLRELTFKNGRCT